MELKTRLVSYMKEDWSFPADIDADALAGEMKEALASADGILRDRLALSGFEPLLSSGRVGDETCRRIFAELVSDRYLLRGLGSEQDDSVFGRAFSGYVILMLLQFSEERKEKLFTKDDVLLAFHAVLRCFEEEKDLRGFVEGKGWAHSIAHNADCLAEFAGDDHIGRDELLAILSAIKERVCQGQGQIISEYDRLREPVFSVLQRGMITEREFADWISDISGYGKCGDEKDDARCILSRCEFLLHLRAKIQEDHPNLSGYIVDGIVKLMGM